MLISPFQNLTLSRGSPARRDLLFMSQRGGGGGGGNPVEALETFFCSLDIGAGFFDSLLRGGGGNGNFDGLRR